MTTELGTAVNIRSKRTRKDVLSALSALKERVSLLPEIPREGLVCYAGWTYV